MTQETRTDLERHLLANPFDAALRARYAQCLLAENEGELALAQYELLCKQDAQHAPGHVGAARALLLLERRPEALSRYAKARQLRSE
jgi:hypothetical protein